MDKENKLYSGPVKILSYILCGLFGAAFICSVILSAVVRLAGYHGLSHEAMNYEAYSRISMANMSELMNRLTMGYIPSENDSGNIRNKMTENWDSAIRDYENVKNTDFAVIISETENLNDLDLDDDETYYYKSPNYESGDDYLFGTVFYTSYYPAYEPMEIILDEYPDNWTGSYSYDEDIKKTYYEYYVYILYSPVKEPVSDINFIDYYNTYDYYDALCSNAKVLSFIDLLYTADSYGIPFAIISFIIAVTCFAIVTKTAGHHKGKEGISLSFFDNIPLEIIGIILVIGEFFLAYCFMEGTERLTYDLWYYMSVGDLVLLYFIAFFVLIMIPLLLYGTIVARIKAKSLIKNTITGKVIIYGIVNNIKALSNWVASHVSMGKRVLICLPVICIVSIAEAAIFQDVSDGGAVLFLGVRILEIAFLLYLVYGYTRLRDGASRIASGNLSEPVDKKHLLPDYKLFADDLNNASESIQLAVDDKLKSEKLKTQLITNVSHDIKTPLTSIINYVDLMQKEDVTKEEQEEYLGILSKQSERLKKLIQDLIDASKASSGAVEVNLETTDICTLVRQVTGEYQDKFEEKNLTLVTKSSDEPCNVSADCNLLWRVMDNLFVNTLKYAMPGTRVYAEVCKAENATVHFSISNISKEALGISEEELMERFVRGDASRNTEGSGLGLSIAKSLMELMGGNLSLKIDGDMFKAVLELKESSEE